MFQVFIKTSNEESAPWELYGVFNSEAEWQNEMVHIRFLRSISPVYLKRGQIKNESKYGNLN